ncbi:HIT family protein [Vulgatibacter sp.]|uniref:HIT family protein n=1 Tax=Vulgatibacter sp. TaxID=1971226 RepID=UPI003564FDFD
MERLWAPWRLAFVEGSEEKPQGCIFCLFPKEGRDRERLVLGRSAHAFVILNKYPYNNGHLLVVPGAHVADPAELAEEAFLDLQRLLRASIAVVREVYGPDALNVGMNLGRAAGAGIADHLHWHVVPRWAGDVNFMPVLAETRVIPEHLDATWAKLRPAFDRALGA